MIFVHVYAALWVGNGPRHGVRTVTRAWRSSITGRVSPVTQVVSCQANLSANLLTRASARGSFSDMNTTTPIIPIKSSSEPRTSSPPIRDNFRQRALRFEHLAEGNPR